MTEPTPVSLPEPDRPCPGATLRCADCRDVLPTLPAGFFDLLFTDPPYPEIDRAYGRWTEAEWWDMMRAVVPECMRLLKPTGSAVFVLQPNSERVGRMRTWLWDFMAWVGREWGIVQDAYWWNHAALPTEMSNHGGGLRASLKTCVWVGPPGCYRDQGAVRPGPSEVTREKAALGRHGMERRAGTPKTVNRAGLDTAWQGRGGVTPYNVLVCAGGGPRNPNTGHGATTPLDVCSFWVRYLCPPGGSVLDPFSGSGTVGLAAMKHGCDYVGVERIPEHHATACRRLADAAGPLFATPPPGVANP